MERDVAPNHCWYQKTRMFLLPHSEDSIILSSFVWVGYQGVTDGRTDRQTELPWLIQRSVLQALRPRCKSAIMGRLWPLYCLYLSSYQIWCKSVQNWPRYALLFIIHDGDCRYLELPKSAILDPRRHLHCPYLSAH